MASIIIITQHLHPQVINLAEQLRVNSNTVSIVTSKNQDISQTFHFQILTPFKKWSAIEAFRLLPYLMQKMPDIIHFVFTKSEEAPTMAHFIISQIFSKLPHRVVASSFFHSPSEMSHYRLKLFLRSSKLVTWGTNAHLVKARRQLRLSHSTVSDVLSPMGHLTHFGDQKPSSAVQRLVQSLGNYILAPTSSFDHIDSTRIKELLSSYKYKILFLDERDTHTKARLSEFHLGEVNTVDLTYVISNARAVLLTFSNLSLLELQKYHQWSVYTKTPLLIRPRQNEMLPGLVYHAKTGWVLEEGEKSFLQLLRDNPGLRLAKRSDNESQLADATINELNRLYQKALNH